MVRSHNRLANNKQVQISHNKPACYTVKKQFFKQPQANKFYNKSNSNRKLQTAVDVEMETPSTEKASTILKRYQWKNWKQYGHLQVHTIARKHKLISI